MKKSKKFSQSVLTFICIGFLGGILSGCSEDGGPSGQTTAGAILGGGLGAVIGAATGQDMKTTLIMAGAGAALGGFTGEYLKRLSERDRKRRQAAQVALLRRAQRDQSQNVQINLPDANVHVDMNSSRSFFVSPEGHASNGHYHMSMPQYEWKKIVETYTPITYGNRGTPEKPITIVQWAYRESPRHAWKITDSPEKVIIETYERVKQQGYDEQQNPYAPGSYNNNPNIAYRNSPRYHQNPQLQPYDSYPVYDQPQYYRPYSN
jgi:hypothetical protein